MRTSLKSVLISLLMLSTVFAVDVEGLMAQGNSFYEKGDFKSAISSYEKILKTDMVSTALHYNLGCAYFSQKEYGKAILQFEKARQLSPRDPDVLHNLEYSKLFLKDRFDLPEPMVFVAWFKELRQSLSLAELKFLEEILFSLLIMGVIIYRLSSINSLRRVLLPATMITGILFLFMGGWLIERAVSMDEKHAILLVDEAAVRSAPIPGASTLFVIHEGTSAEILDATESWYEIRLEDGKTGWIIHEAVGLY
ncbi:MAG: tetratricopeptide repeat protein [Candidatus Marinimicrobia bacterium]|nr:tetratricopeptide repeat protein [Candidatus Neomarinimicrobiota bacterium]MCF7921912.1 tetratricopeptide repeat protein [Candidatus Neomarinimicrobiota bacterium]